jgi:anion-transporting  ArsA/GET3 family ATPase
VPVTQPNLSERLQGKRVCICVGAGGVGKTSTSAALALGLAARGSKVVVVSIDPAKRLAGALGLAELPGQPHRVAPALLSRGGIALEGELWAMMLDSKRTFDELIAHLTSDPQARQRIYSNRIYAELSGAVAGAQEFTAIAKLYELEREGDFDVIVLDTPPARNALDFLHAPTRLGQFLDGRALSLFLAPGGIASRILGRSGGLMFAAFARVSGIDLFGELSAFFGSLAGVIDGFRERVHGVGELLRASDCAFLIVASPQSGPVAEAIFLHRELARAGMPYTALVVNRVHEGGLQGQHAERLIALAADRLGEPLARRVAANLADFDVLVRRDRDSVDALSRALGEPAPVLVPHLDHEVSDLQSLAVIAGHLLGE